MFSLIITIIAIVLVAALAIATLYYGSNNLATARAKAGATTSINQGQQIIGAAQLFRADHSRWPTDIEELVSAKYLNTKPNAAFGVSASVASTAQQAAALTGLLPVAYAATAQPWETVEPVVPFYWLHRIVPESVCKAVNLAMRGDNGIYLAAKPSLAVQCFGPVGQYSVLVGLPGVGKPMEEVIPSADPGLIVSEGGSGWVVPPTQTGSVGSGSGTTPTTPTTPPEPTVPAASYLSTPSMSFGSVPRGEAAPSKALALTNQGSQPLSNIVVGVSGSGFSRTTACPTGSTTLAPGATCIITVGFTPASSTAVTGAITVSATGLASSISTTLSGEGISLPTTTSLSTTTVPTSGGTVVTLTGSNFTSGTKVLVNGTELPTTYVSATQVRFTPPAGTAGTAGTVTVIHPDYPDRTSSSLQFTYEAPPALTQVTGVATGAGNYVPWSLGAAVDKSGNVYSQDYSYSTSKYRILKNGVPFISDVLPTVKGDACVTPETLQRLWIAPTQDLYAAFICDGNSHNGIIGYSRNNGAVVSRAVTSKMPYTPTTWPSADGGTIFFMNYTAETNSVPYNVAGDAAFYNGTNFVKRTPDVRSSFVGVDGATYWVGPNSELQMAPPGSGWIGLGITVAAPHGTVVVAEPSGRFIYLTNSSRELYKVNRSTKEVERIAVFPGSSTLTLGQDGYVYAAVITQGVYRINP